MEIRILLGRIGGPNFWYSAIRVHVEDGRVCWWNIYKPDIAISQIQKTSKSLWKVVRVEPCVNEDRCITGTKTWHACILELAV